MKCFCLITLTSVAVLTNQVWAGDLAVAGRQLLAKYPNSVLTVECQLRQSVTLGAQEKSSETKSVACGTVVNEAGLIAVSLSATVDPSNLLKATNPQARALNIQCEVVSVKILLPEGAEVPAEVAYRDKDLDLAFIRAKEALPKTVTPVVFPKAAKPSILDEVFVLWRYGQLASRTMGIDNGRITGMVTKPRPYYFSDVTSIPGIAGCPVFSADGQALGLIMFRFDSGSAASGAMSVIVSGADILDDIQQISQLADVSHKATETVPAVAPAPQSKE